MRKTSSMTTLIARMTLLNRKYKATLKREKESPETIQVSQKSPKAPTA